MSKFTDTFKLVLADYPMMSQSESEDPIVSISFTQVNWRKYFIYEYDPEDQIAFAYVMWDFSEFWSVWLQEQMDVAKTYNHILNLKIYTNWETLSQLSDFNIT